MVDGIIVKATIDTEKFMPKLMDLNVPVINSSYGAHVLRVNDYHDMPTISELLSLSTIRHPISELAVAASKLMIESIESDGQPIAHVEEVFPTELMVRRTS